MEKKTKNYSGITLRWRNLGPDLSKFPSAQVASFVRQFGEIRFRYVAHLIWGIHQYEDDGDWWDSIVKGLHGNWQSGALIEALGTVETDVQRLQIPWINLYVPNATPRQKEVINRICFAQSMAPVVEEGLIRACSGGGVINDDDEDLISLVNSRLLRIRYTQHPDLSYRSVVQWLSFIVNGSNDPQLAKSFERHRPDLAVRNYAAYRHAWDALVKPATQDADAAEP